MTPEEKVLAQLNRTGWKVVGQRPETQKVPGFDDANRAVTTDQPTGNIVWTIAGPGGQSDEVVVKQHTNTTPGNFDPTEFSIVKGPQNNAQPPAATPGWTDIKPITNNGVTKQYGRDPKDGLFKEVPGLPQGTETKPATTPTSALDIVNDPTTGKPVAYRDPATGNTINLPQTTADKPVVIDGPGGAKYSWNGKDAPTLLIQGTTPDAKPTEGQTRQSVIPGTQYMGQEIFHNGVWSIDPSFTPKPYVPSDKPKEGDVRPATDSRGQAIQEIYRGGSWTTDTSVAPKPFGTQPPTTLNTGTSPYIVQQTADQAQSGQISTIPNPNTTDITARVGQLQTQAAQKRDQLQAAVSSGQKTQEQAAGEFDTWWSANIDPYAQQLTQAQQQTQYDAQIKQRDQQRQEEEQGRLNFNTAEQAGQDAVKNATNFGPGVEQVGPGFAAAFSNVLGSFASGKAPAPIDAKGLTWQAPDLNTLAQNATAAALAHISPTAARIAGRPMPQIPQGMDVSAQLNKSNYTPRGTTLVHPDGTVEVKPPDQTSPQPPPPDFAAMSIGDPSRLLGGYQPPPYSPAAPPF